ncbi:MAG: hypothetical protein ABR574_04235 [Cryomorphaceae bacterium]|nr:hypothetical protein [Flavobacteriales bacterium]
MNKTVRVKSPAEEKAEALELMLKMTTDHMTAVEGELRFKQEKLEAAAKQINESLAFASILQNAIMPTGIELDQHFADHLLFYRQKEAIGGNMLWIKEQILQVLSKWNVKMSTLLFTAIPTANF